MLCTIKANKCLFTCAGYTPLHRCLTLYGSEQTMAMARVLLERGADPNAVTRMGNVPLSDAVMNNRTEFIKLLLEFGVRLLFRRQSLCCGTPGSGAFLAHGSGTRGGT